MFDTEYKIATYYADSDFELKVEMCYGVPLVHLQMYKASKEIINKVMKLWAEIKALAYMDGFEAIYTYTKDERMFRIFGATKVPGTFNFKGQQFKVGKWELK